MTTDRCTGHRLTLTQALTRSPANPNPSPDQVTGYAMGNSLDGSMFGRYFRPRGFRCSANECTGSGSDGNDSSDSEA